MLTRSFEKPLAGCEVHSFVATLADFFRREERDIRKCWRRFVHLANEF